MEKAKCEWIVMVGCVYMYVEGGQRVLQGFLVQNSSVVQ